MVSRRRHAVLALMALAVPAYAQAPDPVVATVGTATLHASDVERRLEAIPAFQRQTFGKSDDDIRRHVVDAILVPELLFAEYARDTKLAAVPRVEFRLREALERALGDSFLREATSAETPDTELRAYYDAHLDEYVEPERIRIARILVDDVETARQILHDAAGVKGLETWKNLAREKSLDAATKLRGGMLGFVHPDGHTDVPQVAVDAALYAAAAKVRNGDLVPEPVKEAGHLGVVWRRGSLPATSRSFEDERDAIRAIVVREKAERAFAAVSEELRQKSVKDENPSLLETLEKRVTPEPPAAPLLPGPGPSTSANPVPLSTDRGLR